MIKITYFVHGTTTDNEEHKATGWLPGELSPLGIKQSKELGTQVDATAFDTIFCSDLKRAIDSAQLAFGSTHPHIIQDERLREANYGDFNGQEENFKERLADYVDTPFPNGESYRDVEARIRSFCEMLKEKYQGKHVAIVAHQAPQLAFEVVLHGKAWPQAIAEDWRAVGKWQPGWEYRLD